MHTSLADTLPAITADMTALRREFEALDETIKQSSAMGIGKHSA